ncbi:DUF3992 domain-containing protein [Bacillus marinisedimentorum]|uniref:DUF3992 domain-containing protein n=1 Tax=Bacillus marinisedimentorum TaxID=1821260 RepID=UPI000D095A00|nr:S-Ena type endospore appendage [Bacillus marinisedimentorum]
MNNGKNNHDNCCFNCCNEKDLVQDKICCDFSVAVGGTPTVVYGTNADQCDTLVASGTIKNCSQANMTVAFVRGANVDGTGGTAIRTAVIPPGGCFVFTIGRFDVIRATTANTEAAGPAQGELCLTPRYKL